MIKGKYILEQVIRKGGLMGRAAAMYINDENKTNQFIKECSEQCHNKFAKGMWGEELVASIIEYTSNRVLQEDEG